jgi:hypothetical protein
MYDQYRFYRLWRKETLAKAPTASDASMAFAWFYAPFLDSLSVECNALRRRANRSKLTFLALCAVGLVFMLWMHRIGVYPAGPPK